MSEDYNRNSTNAVLSRLETKLDDALEKLNNHDSQIRKLWAALGRLDVRVTLIGAGMWGVLEIGKWFFAKQ